MKEIIGQTKLVNKLLGYSFHSMPKTMLLIGESGAGKHFVTKKFVEYLGVDLTEITAQATADQLVEYFKNPIQTVYTLNLSEIPEKQQHKYLKFIEEPSSNMRVILLAESEVGILPTILNRCVKLTFEDYTVDQLKQFSWATQADNPIIYGICKTPGQLLNLAQIDNLGALKDFCINILRTAPLCEYGPFMGFNCGINYKDNFKKFDPDIFLNLLIKTAYDLYVAEGQDTVFDIYCYLIGRKQQLINKTLSKESFMLNTLDGLWRLVH
jgi:tRNA A37 threonylcarbamoyladenosine biosynthesis protein TsaE